MAREKTDWSAILNFSRAVGNCHTEFSGDWYRDPWGWPEIDWVEKRGRQILSEKLGRPGAGAVAKIDVPKENYSTRPAVVLNPVDRLVYQALVDRLSPALIGELHRGVYGWRLPVRDPVGGLYSPNSRQWERFREYLGLLAGHYPVLLKSDVVSCFASIPYEVIQVELQARAPGGLVLERLLAMLESWQNIPGRSGLPQRSLASAVIANMILASVDDVMEYHSKSVSWTFMGASFFEAPHSFVRWMDDLWLFGDDAGKLRQAQVSIQEVLRGLGLELNIGKTELIEGSEAVVAAALELEHSAVDDGLSSSPIDLGPLGEVIQKIVDSRERVSRTEIRFVTTRIREHELYSKVDTLIDVAARLPHGADHLARLFRAAGRSVGLVDWYLEFAGGVWGRMEWAVAQLGTMFSSTESPGKSLCQYFADRLVTASTSLPMTALCADRLSRWEPSTARVVIAETINRVDNPLQRRVLALAALQAGHRRSMVKSWLGASDENLATLKMLESANFKVPKRNPDFDGV